MRNVTGMMSSGSQEWETPPDLFDVLDAEFHFTLDACASLTNFKCHPFYTKEEDALPRNWGSVTWMNPPYGRDIGRWVAKAYNESLLGNTVVCLLPARTDTAWWHDYCIKGEIRFLRGRVHFVGAPYNAPFPSVVVVFRPPAGS